MNFMKTLVFLGMLFKTSVSLKTCYPLGDSLTFFSTSISDEDIESGDLSNCFDNFGRENIVTLFFTTSYNTFTYLPSNIFDGMVNLETLGFGSSSMTSLPDGIFDDLVSLKSFSYSHPNLILDTGMFEGLDSLEDLDLREMKLDTIPDGVFRGLGSLKKLILLDNNLRSLPENVFEDVPSLEILNLSDNELIELPANIFRSLESLLELDIDGNYLLCYPQSYARDIDTDDDVSECDGGFTSGCNMFEYNVFLMFGIIIVSVFLV